MQPDLNDGVLTLTQGNGVAHPLSLAMIHALHDLINQAACDEAMILHGPGHIFCAGHDLKEIAADHKDADFGESYLTQQFTDCSALMLDLTNGLKPSIALVEGLGPLAGCNWPLRAIWPMPAPPRP